MNRVIYEDKPLILELKYRDDITEINSFVMFYLKSNVCAK